MTHIVKIQHCTACTKKGLHALLTQHPDSVFFENPTLGLFPGQWEGYATDLREGQTLTCCDERHRWFASVTRTRRGYVVK